MQLMDFSNDHFNGEEKEEFSGTLNNIVIKFTCLRSCGLLICFGLSFSNTP